MTLNAHVNVWTAPASALFAVCPSNSLFEKRHLEQPVLEELIREPQLQILERFASEELVRDPQIGRTENQGMG